MTLPEAASAGTTRPPDALKVLHIAQMLPGGIISYIEELLPTQMAQFGAENIMALVATKDAELLSTMAPGTVHTFPKSGRSLRELYRFARRALAVVRAERPDIVHLHSTFAGLLRPVLMLLSGKSRPAIVYCAHGWAFNMRTECWRRYIYAMVERVLAHFCDHIICISAFEYRSALARGISPSHMTMIENAITSQPQSPGKAPFRASAGINLLFIGRFDKQKGFDIAEAAMAQLNDVPVTLHAVGGFVVNGTDIVQRQCKTLPNIVHYGWHDRRVVYDFIEQADALVIPSRWEGFGIAAIEAMRQGKPVIAADVDALPEIVIDGVTGIIVPPEDPDALAHAIRGLDRATLARLGRAARTHFLECFTSERLNREILDTYRMLRKG
ncbi:glycosyltransferase [Novosphingobium pituita]|uniref:Glycosyltransferase family 4 protein n=1 Tax=Novosphingobium pituita TaxID=3056842 RepID=A0ABQ6P925_9SPHN|nr:glycosyltransferase [Novosphingobium sp. IK01]GMM60914.1 glycosyltransferase family 4 protein [Novosphingobium sp. IK01]